MFVSRRSSFPPEMKLSVHERYHAFEAIVSTALNRADPVREQQPMKRIAANRCEETAQKRTATQDCAASKPYENGT
jgi:hypothetical protein